MGRAVRDGVGDGHQIEFLSPRESVFGGDGPADFAGVDLDAMPDPDDGDQRPRWLIGAAGVAVLALVGVGVFAAAPWEPADTNVAPPPTTIVPPEPPIEPARTGTAAVAATPAAGFVFDPLPAGFALEGAWRNNSTAAERPVPGWGEVWATSDATASGGAWFSITLLNRPTPTAAPGATALKRAGVVVATIEQRGDGTLQLTAPVGHIATAQHLTIRSFGRTSMQLVALFDSIGIDDDRPQVVDDRVRYLDLTQLDGFARLASTQTDRDLVDAYLAGAPTSTTSYADGTGSQYIIVDTLRRNDDIEAVGRLAVGPARIFATNAVIPPEFTGDDLVLGASPGGIGDEVVARWSVDDTTIVVRTNLSVGDLLPLLPTIRQTTEPEWSVAAQRAEQRAAAAAATAARAAAAAARSATATTPVAPGAAP